MVSGLHSNAHLRPLDIDIISLKRQIQSNKQNISQDRFDLQVGINDVRGLEVQYCFLLFGFHRLLCSSILDTLIRVNQVFIVYALCLMAKV